MLVCPYRIQDWCMERREKISLKRPQTWDVLGHVYSLVASLPLWSADRWNHISSHLDIKTATGVIALSAQNQSLIQYDQDTNPAWKYCMPRSFPSEKQHQKRRKQRIRRPWTTTTYSRFPLVNDSRHVWQAEKTKKTWKQAFTLPMCRVYILARRPWN